MPELGLFTNRYLFAAILVSAVLQVGLVALPPLRPLFETVPLSATESWIVLGLSLVPITLVETMKLARPRHRLANRHTKPAIS
jgi:Ca2+-transporting ATPase